MDSLAVNSYSPAGAEKTDEDLSDSSIGKEFHVKISNEDVDVIPNGDDTFTVIVRNQPFTLRGKGEVALANLLKDIKKKIGDIQIEIKDIQKQTEAITVETTKQKTRNAEKAKEDVANNNKKGK